MNQFIAAINPVAFRLGGIPVAWYGILIGIGIVVAMSLASREGDLKGMPQDFVVDMAFWTVPIAIVGARIYYVVFEWQYYILHPEQIIQIWNGGIAIYGALIAGGITVYFSLRLNKCLSFWR